MAVCFWYHVISDVYTCIVAYTGQVTFYKVPENTAMFNWSSCKGGVMKIYFTQLDFFELYCIFSHDNKENILRPELIIGKGN